LQRLFAAVLRSMFRSSETPRLWSEVFDEEG
jgi:hypothetical protein